MLSNRIILLFISFLIQRNLALKVSFSGSQFIPFLRQADESSEIRRISLRLKTIHPSGILIYGRGNTTELLLSTTQGRLRLFLNLQNKRKEALINYNLANNRWHSVAIAHVPGQITLSLDKKVTRLFTGSFHHLDLQNPIYVGGLDESLLGTSHATVHAMTNFIGCLSDVYIDSVPVLHGAAYHTSGNSTTAPLKLSCPRDSNLIEFPSRKSYIRLSKSSSTLEFKLSLSFRGYSRSGVIAYRAAKNGHVILSLVKGTLVLKVEVADRHPISITMGRNLNNGEWHDVTSGVTSHQHWLSLDNAPEKRQPHHFPGNIGRFQNHVFIGRGVQSHGLSGFIGCMHDVRVNGAWLASRKAFFSFGVVMNSCTLKSYCLPNPCKNGGKCKGQKNGYTCECESSLYRGKHCETPVYRATCIEYRELGLSEDSYCKVAPEGSGVTDGFIVICNVTSSHRAVTVIPHNKKVPQKVSDATFHRNGFYIHHIDYGQDTTSIMSLIRKSIRCRQYISFHCFNTTILNPQNVFWLSGDRISQSYWGGAPKGSQRCACAVAGTCVHGNVFCNCDVGDAKWREDAGYIVDKAALPVSFLQFSNQASQSMYTLGPLECFGFTGKVENHVANTSSYLSQACRPVSPRPTSVVPGSTRLNPTVWSLVESTQSSSPPQSLTSVNIGPENATIAASMSVANSPSKGLDTAKTISTLLPQLTSKTPEPVIPTGKRNDTRKHAPEGASKDGILGGNNVIIIIISIVVAFFVLLMVVVFVLCKRRVCGNTCCAGQQSHHGDSAPQKSIGHDVYSGVVPEPSRPVSMEMGTYNVNNGRWLYQTFDQTGIVKKMITFAPIQDEEEPSLEPLQLSSLGQ